MLRLRVLRHLDNCPKLCDNCRTCNPQKRKLIAAYTPVTIPILIAAELREDGMGLPDSHGCGSVQIPGNYAYLG